MGTTGRRSTRRTTGRSGRELTVQQGWTQGPGFDHPPKPYRFGAFCPVRGVIQLTTASEETPVLTRVDRGLPDPRALRLGAHSEPAPRPM